MSVKSGWDTDQDFTGWTYASTRGAVVRIIARAPDRPGVPNHWWIVEDQTTKERWEVPSAILVKVAKKGAA